jgi:hypothetical protein
MTIPYDMGYVEYPKSDILEVFRCKGLLSLVLTPGVGFAASDGKTHYFWTLRPAKVLATLRAAGYSIGKARRPKGVVPGQFPWPRRGAGP